MPDKNRCLPGSYLGSNRHFEQGKFNNLAERLRKANFYLQPVKCEFLRPEVGYLGHIIDKNEVRPDPKKIIAAKNFPIPKHRKMLNNF